MKVITLGSRACDDAIIRTTHNNLLRVRGISPFSFNCDDFNEEVILVNDIPIENSYIKKMFLFDVNKTLKKNIQEMKYDYLLLDFVEALQPFWEVELVDGRKIRFTYSKLIDKMLNIILSNLEENVSSKINSIKLIEPLKWSEQCLEKEILKFCDWISCDFDMDKIVLCDITLPFHRVSSNGIEMMMDFHSYYEQKKVIEKIYKVVKEKLTCKYIAPMDVSLGTEKCILENCLFTDSYIKYISNSIDDLDKQSKSEQNKKEYLKSVQGEIDMCLLKASKDKIISQNRGRRAILLGCDEQIRDAFKEECNLEVETCIEYDEDTDIKTIEKKMEKYRGRYSEFHIIVLHLYNDLLLKTMYKLGFAKGKDLFAPSHEIIFLKNFIGEYIDVFHNVVKSDKETNIYVCGAGGRIVIQDSNRPVYTLTVRLDNQVCVDIGENVQADKLVISTLTGCNVAIGRDSTFADNCSIAMGEYNCVKIGNDCMFSSKVVVHAADGHSIFNQDTGEKTNSNNSAVDTSKTEIIICNHVWIGYQVFLLPKTVVGNGSIVGARSVLNKKYPNNCIIAGNVAKVIKKDIGWARDPFETDIYDSGLDCEYLKYSETD